MRAHSNVSPAPLPVDQSGAGISIEYLDGRRVTYHADPEDTESDVEATITREVHVLVVDPRGEEGVMVYVNDYDTDDEILEATGVGRVLLSDGDVERIFPGVTATRQGERILIDIDEESFDGWAYVFVENQLGEHAYRLATPSDA